MTATDTADLHHVQAIISLGANLGDARSALNAATAALGELPHTRVLQSSSHYRTAPVEASGPDYINSVAIIETALDPQELLLSLQTIEFQHGRDRPYPNAPRTLDLDLLLYGDQEIDLPQLQVPHPRGHLRAFVLAPLQELMPDGLWPGHGRLEDLLPGLSDQRVDRLA
ncbi:MAG: hypothetical protein RJA44_1420 [Pseudomonadota bacterium]